MSAAALVESLRARGVTLKPRGGDLTVQPKTAVTPAEVIALRQHKREVLRLLTTPEADPTSETSHHVAEALPFLAMPLDEFRARGALLEVRVPWLSVTLWMVPAEGDVELLLAEGVSRGRIWTAAELTNLMTICDRTPEGMKTITHAKLLANGDIVEVRRR